MNKLLAANVFRIRKDKVFWGCAAFMAAFGSIMPIMHYRVMVKEDYTVYIDEGFFFCATFIGILLSVFCSLFVGTEYSDGTIRNKVVAGQKRSSIYLANLVTNVAAGLFLCTVSFFFYLCLGLPLLGSFQADIKVIFLFVLATWVLSAAFSSIFTCISMLNQSKSGSAVICILTAFLFLFAASYIDSRLSEPETYDDYMYMDESGEIVMEESQPNPNYLDGTEREVYQALFDILPGGQSLQITSMISSYPERLTLYSCIVFLCATGAGLLIFQKKDLR